MNKCTALGRLGKDIELTYSKDGKAIGKFSLGVTRKFNKDITDWFNCVSFGKQAETLAQYVKKGQQLLVSGEIHFGSYDAQDGTKRYTTDVVVDNFEFVGSSKGNESIQSSSSNSTYSNFNNNSNMQTADLSEDPYKEFSEETSISSDEFPF